MRPKRVIPDQLAAKLAARQHDVIEIGQLLRCGLSRAAVKRRVAAGRMHSIYRGVYTLGSPRLTREGYWMAAVLSVGAGAVLSHQSAAALWKISPTSPSLIHVTVPRPGGRRHRRGIAVHRSTTLARADITIHRGIPVTSFERTLRDLGYGPEPTRSDLERLFVKLCRKHRLPTPEFNVKIGPHTVDALWRAERLIVEIDSWAYHRSRAAFEADRARDRDLILRGFNVLRYVDREVAKDPAATAYSLQAHLRDRVA
jgi:very-short-patch-repair endonuclease